MNYSELKILAKQIKTPVKNLIALAPGNDPFYVGAPAQKSAGEWFAQCWEAGGFSNGAHIRRIHYWIVSQDEPVIMRNGKAYENTDACWKELCSASKAARYLNLVPISAFDDRRNPPAVVYEDDDIQGGNVFFRSTTGSIYFEEMDMPRLPSSWVYQPVPIQRYMIEVWCEKSTMNDVLEPICRRYGCNLITGLGELSVTAVDRLFYRIRMTDKPTRILYISDFDPAGKSMPVAVSRKAEYMLQDSNRDLRVISIALTADQVKQYQLPRTPIKDSERRKAGFEDRYGEGATELDALEALHPGALDEVVTDAVMQYRDTTLHSQISKIYREAEEQARADRERVYTKYQEEIATAKSEWQGVTMLLDEWKETYQPLWKQMAEEMDAPFYMEAPEAAYSDEEMWPLFNSDRSYLEQMQAYRLFQGKEEPHG